MNKDFDKFARTLVSTSKIDGYRKRTNNYGANIIEKNIDGSQVDIFTRLLQDRIVFLGTDIDDDVANMFNAQLLYLQMIDPTKDITVFINSGGGSVYAGMGMLDTMDYVQNDIITINTGLSASMAAVILSNGTKGKRKSLKRSRTMIHQPLGYLGYAQATDIEIESKEINILKLELYKTLSDNSGRKIEDVRLNSERDYWMSADETQKYGIIDHIILKHE
jgi:ATP-dependent Clp protease protease subunit